VLRGFGTESAPVVDDEDDPARRRSRLGTPAAIVLLLDDLGTPPSVADAGDDGRFGSTARTVDLRVRGEATVAQKEPKPRTTRTRR
jgi:hypothetical protein